MYLDIWGESRENVLLCELGLGKISYGAKWDILLLLLFVTPLNKSVNPATQIPL